MLLSTEAVCYPTSRWPHLFVAYDVHRSHAAPFFFRCGCSGGGASTCGRCSGRGYRHYFSWKVGTILTWALVESGPLGLVQVVYAQLGIDSFVFTLDNLKLRLQVMDSG